MDRGAAIPPRHGRGAWWVILLVAAVVTIAYVPALRAGWIWDDDAYILENPVVQEPRGVLGAWVPGATPQWYPLVFISFWVQNALHGPNPFGYHLVNLLLHLASTFMLWRLLVALRLPGATLAAALFAVHPVQVETVAWVTERKNVLSMAFALASMLAWVRFLRDPRPFAARAGRWVWSFILFACAMLSKTTAVAVPVAMAAVAWWRPWEREAGDSDDRTIAPRRGRSIAALTFPFFLLGIVLGLFTARVEATHVGAHGAEFARPLLERLLQAGQAWWFYQGTWCWPRGLMFVYPPFAGPSWLPWIALASGVSVAVAALVAARRGTRGAAVAFLTYSAGILPALGFINLYPLRFAPVADHFGYVASAVLAPAAAYCLIRVWRAAARWGMPRTVGPVLAAAIVVTLAVAAHAHTAHFANAETLWRVSLKDNPRAWLASNNLVSILLARVQEATEAGDAAAKARALSEASRLAETSVALAGTIDMTVQANLSEVRRLQGRLPEALAALDAAIAMQPDVPAPHWQRGRLVEMMGRFADAGPEYARAVEISPHNGFYLREYLGWLTKSGRLPEARDVAARIVAIDPDDAESLADLGGLALRLGDIPAARRDLLQALSVADGKRAAGIAVRAARACLAPPLDTAAVGQARAIAEQLVRSTGGEDPLPLLLLARAQATLREPDARETLRRADALLAIAPVEVREAAAPDRAAIEALISAGGPAPAPPR